jgi:2-methylaconitate cis-trans-isomerase PrpF
VAVSLVDVGGPVAFVQAAELGLDPLPEPATVNADADLLDRLEELRGACAVLARLAGNPAEARAVSPALPRLALVGDGSPAQGSQLSLRVMSMQRMHHACPITVLMCAAAAAWLPGTVPSAASRPPGGDGTVLIAHPKGLAAATVLMADGPVVHSVSLTHTARRLLAGQAYL